MRCCPVCYSKVRPTVYGTATTGTSLEIKYKIQCRNCGFGCDKAGSVIECTDNGGGHQAFEVKAENKQEAIKKGMAFAKKHASGDICGDWECKMISEWTT